MSAVMYCSSIVFPSASRNLLKIVAFMCHCVGVVIRVLTMCPVIDVAVGVCLGVALCEDVRNCAAPRQQVHWY
eukprot:3797806-Amphidinium_carterae.1